MGCASSRCGGCARKTREELRADVRLLLEEIEETRRSRQGEAWEYEWRLAEEERRRLEEEAAGLRKSLEEEIYRRRRLEAVDGGEDGGGGVEERPRCSRGGGGGSSVVEQARREETVEKWKQLYLTIKTELDELIHRTREEGGRFGWGSEENKEEIEELQRDLREKEESVEALTSQIAAMQKEASKNERENDILRQCLKILGSNTNRDLNRNRKQFNKKSFGFMS